MAAVQEIDGYDSADSDASGARSPSSPGPEENLLAHPHFRMEFELPWGEYDPLIAPRRQSSTSPPPASPTPAPASLSRTGRRKGKASETGPSRRGSLLANLVGGESDSSALTESDEEAMDVDGAVESAKPSRRGSVMTGTPTEATLEDEDDGTETASKLAILLSVMSLIRFI